MSCLGFATALARHATCIAYYNIISAVTHTGCYLFVCFQILRATSGDETRSTPFGNVDGRAAQRIASRGVHQVKVSGALQWNFMRSLDDKVEREECSLSITSNGPERESLKRIAEKIYGMFSVKKKRSN